MDHSTLMSIIAVIGCIVGVFGLVYKRDDKCISDAVWKGEVNGKLDAILGINHKLDTIEKDIKTQGERIAKVESKADSAHHRLDDHINKETI